MFTGIVREVGVVEALERSEAGGRLRLRAGLASELREGDSVAVAGACLTVSALDDGTFAADVMNQTLSLTTLGELQPGDRVNLEPALRAGEPLGGHLVQGHVDATGEVRGIADDGFSRRLRIAADAEVQRYLIERGSVAVDGASLTVASLGDGEFEVSLIPETLARTTLAGLAEGGRVNVELDLVARYVERLMASFRD